MGTRSTVKFYDEFDNQKVILSVYQQFDGYIEGVGYDLAEFLKDKTIGHKTIGHKMLDGFANGMGCLAAQYVAEKKTDIGGFYLTTDDDEQEFNYEVRFINGNIIIKVGDFEGTPDELLNCSDVDIKQ